MTEMVKGLQMQGNELDGSKVKVGIVRTRWNMKIVDALLKGCREELKKCKVEDSSIYMFEVPGAYELPYAASRLIRKHDVDVVICLGCLIKGETMHFEYIAEAVSQGIMRVGLDKGVPVIFGVLTTLTEDQALARAGLLHADTTEGKGHNHGNEWASSAVEMAIMKKRTDDK